jgi:hypothetical protein
VRRHIFALSLVLTAFSSAALASGFFVTPTTYPAGGTPEYVAAGDFNGDGILDVCVALKGQVGVFLGLPGGGFSKPVDYTTGTTPVYIAVGDLNGDGHPDLVVVNSGGKDSRKP